MHNDAGADVERYRISSKMARTLDAKYDTTRINKLVTKISKGCHHAGGIDPKQSLQ